MTWLSVSDNNKKKTKHKTVHCLLTAINNLKLPVEAKHKHTCAQW